MKAWVLHDKNDIRLEEREIPVPKRGEVLLRVGAVGICGSDIQRVFVTGAHHMPLIPGHEFSGVAESVGEGTDPSLIGKRYGVFPLIPCRKCGPCLQKKYELCRNYDYLGSRRDGAYAELVTAPAENLIPLPEKVSLEEAAMLEPLSVAMHALLRGRPRKEETVALIGLGTIGLMLAMLLKEEGINPLCIGNRMSQSKKCQRLGIPEEDFYNVRDGGALSWLAERTKGRMPEVVFECVGKEETYSLTVDALSPAGRAVLVGNPASAMGLSQDIYWKLLRNQLTLTGTWNSSFTGEADDDWHRVLGLIEEGRISPKNLISHRLSLPDLMDGLTLMRDKREDYTKIILSLQPREN